MFRLRIDPSSGPSFETALWGNTVRIGRADDCELKLDDPFLSRYHTCLRWDEGEILVEDLDSANGTFVNGQSVSGVRQISPEDVIRISEIEIQVLPQSREEEKPEVTGSDDVEITMLRPMDEILAEVEGSPAAVQERERLRQQATRLRLLNELHQALSAPVQVESLVDLVLDGAFENLSPDRAAIFLRDASGDVETVASRRRDAEAADLPVSRTLIQEVMEKGQAAIALDVEVDERFSGSESILAAGATSLVAAPLQDSDGCIGMIVLSSRLEQRAFDEDDLHLLVSLASVATMRIRNLRLVEEAVERKRLENELEMARQLQESLLPTDFPQASDMEVYGVNTASRWVSGDYFQVMTTGEDEWILAVADVCGKGMAAALLAAKLEAVWSMLIRSGLSPERICTQMSRFLHQRTPPDRFATAFFAMVDLRCGRVRYVNAGHNPPFLLRSSGDFRELEATGFPFGMVPEAEYDVAEMNMGADDLLVCFTDGIVEAANPAGEQYQLGRLVDICQRTRARPLRDIVDALEGDLREFADGVPFVDDRTLLLLRRGASSND